ADHRDPVLRMQRGKLRARAVGSERRAGERGRERFVDPARVHQVLRVRHEHVRGVGSGAIHTQESGFQAVIVLSGLADRTLAAVEIALPDMQVRMTHARARHAHEHLACLRFRCLLDYSLQRFAVLDDVVTDHALPASCSAWSMSQRMSSSVSMPTEMRTMSGVTPVFSWSAS